MLQQPKKDVLESPLVGIYGTINSKWAILILFYLSQWTLRFGELHQCIPMATEAVLSRELKNLVKHGLVHREIYREVPPRVEYSLTAIGKEFVPVLDSLQIFAIKYNKFQAEHPGKKL
jgi:DNA-binding HxlR family transcriptional regulator